MLAQSRESCLPREWLIIGACFIGTLVVFGISYSFGVFFDRILAEFHRSRGTTSLVFSIHTFVLYFGAVIVGLLVEKYGPRHLLLFGTFLLGAGLFAAGQSQSLSQVIAFYSIVASFGLSNIYVVSYTTVPKWFDKRRGFATGIATSGLGVGMLFISPASAKLISLFGWRTAFLVLSISVIIPLSIAALMISSPPNTESNLTARPGRGQLNKQSSQPQRILSIIRTRPFVLLFIGWVFIYSTLYVVFSQLVVYVSGIGLPQ